MLTCSNAGLLAGSDPYDVLFCRNLLIYLTRSSPHSSDLGDRSFAGLDGLVFIGHADRLDRGEIRASIHGGRAGRAFCLSAIDG